MSAYSEEAECSTDMLRLAHRLTETRDQEAAFYLTSALVHSNLAIAESIREALAPAIEYREIR
jgi:hypothetical protein